MGHASLLSALVLEQFLIQARLTKAVASLRLQGTNARLLGDLRIQYFRPGSVLEQFLIQSRLTKAVTSLRLQGPNSRLLGDLRIHAFRPGSSLEVRPDPYRPDEKEF